MRDTHALIVHGRRFGGFEPAIRGRRALMAVAAMMVLCGTTVLVLRHNSPEAPGKTSTEAILYDME